jgi:hypothetical protein
VIASQTPPLAALSDLATVIDAARDVLLPFEYETAWWRGHAKAVWPLEAQVYRRDIEHPERQLYDETSLIGHFVTRAPSRSHRPCPAVDDYFGWLFWANIVAFLPACWIGAKIRSLRSTLQS